MIIYPIQYILIIKIYEKLQKYKNIALFYKTLFIRKDYIYNTHKYPKYNSYITK